MLGVELDIFDPSPAGGLGKEGIYYIHYHALIYHYDGDPGRSRSAS